VGRDALFLSLFLLSFSTRWGEGTRKRTRLMKKRCDF